MQISVGRGVAERLSGAHILAEEKPGGIYMPVHAFDCGKWKVIFEILENGHVGYIWSDGMQVVAYLGRNIAVACQNDYVA